MDVPISSARVAGLDEVIDARLVAHGRSRRFDQRSSVWSGYEYVTGLPFLETTIISGGLSISYRRRSG